MRKMKDSGLDIVGQMPNEWNFVRLRYLCNITTGNSDTQDADPDGEYLFYVRSPIIERSTKYTFDGEGILMAGDGAGAGRVFHHAFGKYAVHQRVYRLYNFKINSNFLFYYVSNLFPSVMDKGSAQSTVPSVRLPMLLNFEVCTPPLLEQKKIADFLDEKCGEIDSIKADVQRQIELLNDYKKSVITEAVTKGLNPKAKLKDSGIEWIGRIPEYWEVKKTKYCFEFGKGLPITKENLEDSGISVISYGQIHSKQNNGTSVNSSLIRFVNESYLRTNPLSLVHKNDFIFADTSEDLDGCGNCVYIDTKEPIFAGYHTIIFRSKQPDAKYFAYLFLTDCWRSQIRKVASGVKLFSITQKILKETSVIIPPLSEQKEIANYLDDKCTEIDAVIADKQKQLETLDEYKKSLIFEYVTGKKEVAQ